jgi:hypothetical protein
MTGTKQSARFRSVGEWELARPFRAWESSFGLDSQGAALGYRRTPRWGWGARGGVIAIRGAYVPEERLCRDDG